MIAYHLLRDRGVCRDLRGSYYDSLHPLRTQNRLIRWLERLGLQVIVRPTQPAPELATAPSGHKRRRGRPCKCLERRIDCKHMHL